MYSLCLARAYGYRRLIGREKRGEARCNCARPCRVGGTGAFLISRVRECFGSCGGLGRGGRGVVLLALVGKGKMAHERDKDHQGC